MIFWNLILEKVILKRFAYAANVKQTKVTALRVDINNMKFLLV